MIDSDLIFYRKIAQNLYLPFMPDDGVDIEEIRRAEKSLGFKLPKTLREFYLLTGNHEAINDSHNRLLSVEYLEPVNKKRPIFMPALRTSKNFRKSKICSK